MGFKVRGDQKIEVDGQVINKEEKVVYILNKPKNIISSAKDDKGRTTVVDLIDTPYRIFPVGRLDFDSSGLLLMTNDGELANMLIHPRYKVPKVYEVTIDNVITNEEIYKLEQGVKVDNYVSAKAHIKRLKVNNNKHTTTLKMTIYEGHNRQIRKMFATLGYTVVKLHRIQEANLTLDNLPSGGYRKLKPFEVVTLKKYLNRSED